MKPKPGRDRIRYPLDRSHRFNRQESKERCAQPQADNRGERLAEVEAAKGKARDAVPKQRIKKGSQQRSRKPDQYGVKPEALDLIYFDTFGRLA